MMLANLMRMYLAADATDRAEGARAYARYHGLMGRIADRYGTDLARVVGGFVALSPNSDYVGNVRSLISVLDGIRDGRPCHDITVSTYKHCRNRAYAYLTGKEDFMTHAKGLKTRAFYMNVLDPTDPDYVTVDGHIYGAWVGQNLTMKKALVSPRKYRVVEADLKLLAAVLGKIPNEVQATIWFARKRVLGIKYNAQLGLFAPADDKWGTSLDLATLRAYQPASPRASA
ncbi:hypothetical protein NKJ10_17630 [Mesorhizobium sp. M0204]|uniref:DUF7178 family protein n=1 Tax=Mesorhizobium sp. M0204 TaxID=2956913 RepID=UPI00333DA99E